MEMAWPCAKNGDHSTCKNRTDMDISEKKEKGRPRTTWKITVMEKMRNADIGWERAHTTSPRQSNLEGLR